METLTFEGLPKAISQLQSKLDHIEHLLLERTEKTSIETDELLTVKQVAEFLNLAVPTIYTIVSKGEMPVMKKSKRLYFSRKEILIWLKNGRKKTRQEIGREADAYILRKEKFYIK